MWGGVGVAAALFTDFDRLPPAHRSYARWMFMDEDARSLFVDRQDQARAAVESLRFEVGRDPDARATVELVAQLRADSREFDQWWEQHRVHQRTHGSKRLRHPLVGDLTARRGTESPPHLGTRRTGRRRRQRRPPLRAPDFLRPAAALPDVPAGRRALAEPPRRAAA
ncbi:hypothetical protein ACFQ34_11975, partial [Pseudonocardia benzenivorans]